MGAPSLPRGRSSQRSTTIRLGRAVPHPSPDHDVASLISTRLTAELVKASDKAITNLTDRAPITNDGDNNHHPPTLANAAAGARLSAASPKGSAFGLQCLPSRATLSTRTEAASGSLEGQACPSSRSTQLGHPLCGSAALPLVSQLFLKRWEPSIAAPPWERKSRKDDGAAAARILAVHLSR